MSAIRNVPASVSPGPASYPFRVEPVTGALGAEIIGVDISQELDDATIAAIRRALLEHCVVFFRDQNLDAARHKAFTQRFGTPFIHPNLRGVDSEPAIIEIRREPGDTKIIGEDWHSDTTHVEAPPMGALLYAMEVPPYGGDTMFANQYMAYEALSPGMKSMLAGMRVLHSDILVAGPTRNLAAANAKRTKSDAEWRETATFHPVVRTHPETGRKALYVNRQTSVRFEDMTEAESKPLIEYLSQHAHRPEFTCRFHWRKGSLAFWDNRCSQHIAVNDRMPSRRFMRRLQIQGEKPA